MAATQLEPTELVIRLDAAVLFLDGLTELPAFDGLGDALDDLREAVGVARDAQEKIAGLDLDAESFQWLLDHGLYNSDFDNYTPAIDHGSGADVKLLSEKLEHLAKDVVGVEWDRSTRSWVEY